MGYIVCEKCGDYYKLQKGELPDDFGSCQCGGRLDYYNHISDYLREEKPSKNSGGHREDFHHEKEELNSELELYQNIKKGSRISPYRSEKILINSGAVILVFALCPFLYGIIYHFWPLTVMGLVTVFLSCWLYLNSRNKDKIAQESFMERVYTVYGIFFVSIAIMFVVFLIANYNKMVNYGGYYLCFFIIFVAIYFSVTTFVKYSVPYDPLSPRDPRSNIEVEFYRDGIPQYERLKSQDPFNSKESVLLVLPVIGILLIWIIG